MNANNNKPKFFTISIRDLLTADPNNDIKFSGPLITGQKLFRELTIILYRFFCSIIF